MDIEKRNDIVFGMFDLGQDVDGMAIGSFDYIKKDIMDIKTSYIWEKGDTPRLYIRLV